METQEPIMQHNTGCFTIFDSKANAHIEPFYSPTIETAKRRFKLAINTGGPFADYPEDYTLFYCGEFDHILGNHNLLPTKTSVVNGLLLKEDTNDQ